MIYAFISCIIYIKERIKNYSDSYLLKKNLSCK
jgi:hypothetical protein